MSRKEGLIITNRSDTTCLPLAERRFARLLLPNPNLQITYECDIFSGVVDGQKKATSPDFAILNIKKGTITEVEITLWSYDKSDPQQQDPKRVHNEIMRQNKGVRHVTLYLDNLVKIQRVHPEFVVPKRKDVLKEEKQQRRNSHRRAA